MPASKQARAGFTLIELLVVIAIIALLAGLTVAFLPGAASSARESRAASGLQGWLNISRQRALRDQAPRGIRLWFPNSNFGVAPPVVGPVTECQYLEAPDDFTGGLIFSGTTTLPNDTIGFDFGFSTGDLVNGYTPVTIPNFNDPNLKFWSVQPGDYIEVLGSGLMHRVEQISANGMAIMISPPLAQPISSKTPNYRIVRAPRPVGDEMLRLQADTIVDLSTNFANGNPLPLQLTDATTGAGYLDVVFAPSGAVITRGVATPNIHLWVRSPDANAPGNVFSGDPTIVSIYTRTGFTSAFRPAQPPANAYALME